MTAPAAAARPWEWLWLPHLDPANASVPEWTYLVCLRPPVKHARHYTGSTHDLADRLARHRDGRGSPLLRAAVEAGGDFVLVRTWPGGRNLERAFHDCAAMPRYCPDCCPTPRVSLPHVTPRHVRRARRVEPPVVVVPARPRRTAAEHAERGARAAERFLADRASWSADAIEQAATRLTTPYREGGRRTPAGDAEQSAFAEVITAALAALRGAELARSA